jgi:sec-independent protein translocase protein TatA
MVANGGPAPNITSGAKATSRRSVAHSCPNRYPEDMPNVGPWEIILLLLLALLLFGAKRLPEIGRSMGKGMREFKDSVSGKDVDDEPAELPMQTTDATIAARERERDPV